MLRSVRAFSCARDRALLVTACALVLATALMADQRCTLPGLTVATDPSGDQSGTSQQDIQSLSIAQPYDANNSGIKVYFTLKVANLSPVAQPNSRWITYFVRFNGDGSITEWFVAMITDNGSPAFIYGHTTGTGTARQLVIDGTPDSGAYNSDGTVTISIAYPTQNSGGMYFPPFSLGEGLGNIYSETRTLLAVGPSMIADATAKSNYQVVSNDACATAATPTPTATVSPPPTPTATPSPGFVATTNPSPSPFWEYGSFLNGIGGGGMLLGARDDAGIPEVILGAGTHWQTVRYNRQTANYDVTYVSRTYPITNPSYPGTNAGVARIATGNVRSGAGEEILVLLSDGRLYFYDLASKQEHGILYTGLGNGFSTFAMTLADLDGDGLSEILISDRYSLCAFNGSGTLLWKLSNVDAYDIVVGQMDDDSALEIATFGSNGVNIIDASSHSVQWTYKTNNLGQMKLAPLRGASYNQLIVGVDWQNVVSLDVAKQVPLWSIKVDDINAVCVADVDGDGTPEVLVGDGQWGSIHVYDLNTQAEKWVLKNPAWGLTNLLVSDFDGDGVVDLMWGNGSSADLYVANTTGDHSIKWQSLDLDGPYFGPFIGDVDGDGWPELVICSRSSEASYGSARIVVFDLLTLTVRAISPPLGTQHAPMLVQDVKLRDIDGDGRLEILVATNEPGDSLMVYSFDTNNNFTHKWASTDPYASFTSVDAADLDGSGRVEIIGARASDGSNAPAIYVYDYPSTTNAWHSVSVTNNVKGLLVQDLDRDGRKEIVALTQNGDLYTFNGAARTLANLKQQTGGNLLASTTSPPRLIVADSNGVGHFWDYANSNYTEAFTRQLASGKLDGLNVTDDGNLWVGAGATLSVRPPPSYDQVDWQSGIFGDQLGRQIATAVRNGQRCVFSSATHSAAAFTYHSSLPDPAPTPTPPPRAIPPAQSQNISTRVNVLTGDNVMIGGFIVTGSSPKKVIVRAIGPSTGIAGALSDPTLELHLPDGSVVTNDDWKINAATGQSQESDVRASGVPPSDDRESALVLTLNPGSYTAVVRGKGGATGIGLVEVYDIGAPGSALANISTRGFVDTGDNVMIGGFIIGPQNSTATRIAVRAIGPSTGVNGPLADPMLELHDGNGAVVAINDNWQDDPSATEITSYHLAPADPRESAIIRSLSPGKYTAVVRGANSTTGVALVEVYNLR